MNAWTFLRKYLEGWMCVYFFQMGKYRGKIFQQVQIGINEWVMKMYYYMFWYKCIIFSKLSVGGDHAAGRVGRFPFPYTLI
jgi:hypothetical protein